MSLWDKVDYTLIEAPAATPAAQARQLDAEQWRRFWSWRRPLLDGIASILWVYAVMKLFVVDVDAELLGDVARYRFFFFVAVALLIVVLFRKTWTIVAAFAYILGFPLVLVFWKLPKLIYKTRSPVAFLAVANAVSSLLGNVKTSVVVVAVAAFAALAIALAHAPVLLAIAGLAMGGLLAQALYRTIKASVAPSRFLRVQQKAIQRSVDSQVIKTLITPGEELRRAEIEKFTPAQQQSFVQNLANGVIANRALYYWAYQLEQYRRSPASIFFNGLAYLWLIIRVVLALALLTSLSITPSQPRSLLRPRHHSWLLCDT